MQCPYCSNHETSVLDSRETPESSIRRRRECAKCNKRFTTYERMETLDLIVVKKDGSREEFNPNKVFQGLLKACEKRPVAHEQIKQAVDNVQKHLLRMETTEIPSIKIGSLVMEELKKIDEVAYIRFASVYREFEHAREFAQEIARLKKKGKSAALAG